MKMPLPKNRTRAQALVLLRIMVQSGVKPVISRYPDNSHYDLSYLEELGWAIISDEKIIYCGPYPVTIVD